MAGKSAVLTVKILSDASKATQGLDSAAGKVAKLQDGARKALPAATAIAAGLAAVGVAAVKAASEQEQAQGAVAAIYGESAAAVDQYSKTSVDRLGLSAAAYMNYSALVGAALQNAGFSAQQAAGMADKAMVRAADLAATFGGTTADAVDAINAAVARSEFDPLEKYGIALNQTAVNAELAKRGQDDLTGAALKQAKAQATLDLIYKQSAGAAGQFARESDTVAGQQQRAAAAFEDAAAALGAALLPAVTDVTKKLAEMANWISQNTGLVLTIGAALGTFAAAVFALNAAITVYTTITTAAQIATKLWNSSILILRARLIAMAAAEKIVTVATIAWNAATKAAAIGMRLLNAAILSNPVGLLVTAIILAVTAIVLLWKKNEGFRNFVIGAWQAIATAAQAAWNWIKNAIAAVIDWAKPYIQAYGQIVKAVWNAAKVAASVAWKAIKVVINAVINFAKAYIKGYLTVVQAVFRAITTAARASWNAVKTVVKVAVDFIKTYIRTMKTVVTTVFNAIRNAASTAFNAMKNAARTAFGAIKGPIDAVKSAIDRVIDAAQSLISWLGRIKVPKISLPSVGGLNPFNATAPAGRAYSPYAAPALYAAPTFAGATGGRLAGPASSSGSGNIIINVSGTLNDVDSAAAVRRVLRNDQRRRDGIVIDRLRQGLVN